MYTSGSFDFIVDEIFSCSSSIVSVEIHGFKLNSTSAIFAFKVPLVLTFFTDSTPSIC